VCFLHTIAKLVILSFQPHFELYLTAVVCVP
jgi:hypothetical protein